MAVVNFIPMTDIYTSCRAYARRPEIPDADFDVMFANVEHELHEPLRGPDQLVSAEIDWTPTEGVDVQHPDYGWLYEYALNPVEVLHFTVNGINHDFVPADRYISQKYREPYQPICTMIPRLPWTKGEEPTTEILDVRHTFAFNPAPEEGKTYALNIGAWVGVFLDNAAQELQVMDGAKHVVFQRMMMEFMIFLAWDERVPLFQQRYQDALTVYNTEGKKSRHQMTKLVTTPYHTGFVQSPP